MYALCQNLKSALTKLRNRVMISYGRTPPFPTMPPRTTLPGIHVLASSKSTPATGAEASPRTSCILFPLDVRTDLVSWLTSGSSSAGPASEGFLTVSAADTTVPSSSGSRSLACTLVPVPAPASPMTHPFTDRTAAPTPYGNGTFSGKITSTSVISLKCPHRTHHSLTTKNTTSVTILRASIALAAMPSQG